MDTKLFSRKQSGGIFSVINRAEFPTGRIWWVDSTNSTNGANVAGAGHNPDAPFLTWVFAISQASAGDIIYLMPSHAETVGATGAAAVTLALAGLQTIGLGGRTLKPTILIDGFADTFITITAADTTIENVAFKSGHANVAKGFNVAAAGATFRGCTFLENTAAENFLVTIQTTAAGDDLLVEDCVFYGVTQATECIELVGANNRVTIRNNFISGLFSVSAISASTVACLALQIDGNTIYNATAAGDDLAGSVDLFAASTGFVLNNTIYLGDDTDILTSIDAGNCGRGGNTVTNEFGQEGGVGGTQAA